MRAEIREHKHDREQGPLPGNGPWFRLDGVWYTKDEAGE